MDDKNKIKHENERMPVFKITIRRWPPTFDQVSRFFPHMRIDDAKKLVKHAREDAAKAICDLLKRLETPGTSDPVSPLEDDPEVCTPQNGCTATGEYEYMACESGETCVFQLHMCPGPDQWLHEDPHEGGDSTLMSQEPGQADRRRPGDRRSGNGRRHSDYTHVGRGVGEENS